MIGKGCPKIYYKIYVLLCTDNKTHTPTQIPGTHTQKQTYITKKGQLMDYMVKIFTHNTHNEN